MLFLLNTMEQEEVFYIYKENKVMPKDGFYIYHRARKKEAIEENPPSREIIPIKVRESRREELPKKKDEMEVDVAVDILSDVEVPKYNKGGRYRQLINEKKKQLIKEEGNIGVAIAVAMLIFVIGVGVYEDRDKIFGTNNSVPTNMLQEKESQVETEIDKDSTEAMQEEVDAETAEDVIPVEVISGTEESDK